MCTGPELLCLDEPAAGLNPKESLALNALLMDIKHNTGTSILLIEHDMSVVMQISDHVVVLEYGRKISDGNPNFVKSDPRVVAAYLGVEDEEVEEVLIEVGDEQVIEQFDAEPDREHGPSASSSMMAGSVSDTIGHSDDNGERITVSKRASKAQQVDDREARAKARAAAPAAEPGKAKAAPVKPAIAKAPKSAAPKAKAVANKLPAPRGGVADRLMLIKGIGPVNEKKLNEHGIFHFDQIAAWKKADIEAVEAYLAFDGRIAREDWVGQARKLARSAAKPPAAKPATGKRGGSR
jgi:branched-chain amino acid transport system ATP-binding protein